MVSIAVVPTARRPRFPGYGVHEADEGLLPWEWATERLERSRNYWIASTRPDGSPHAMPVWGIWYDGALWFGTNPTSRKGKNLARDPRVVAHLESGDEVVVLEGEVEVAAVPDGLAAAYNEKYEMEVVSPGDELWRVRHRLAYAWREHDYPQSATRFDFP